MDQRIKELAEQAGYTPLPGFDFANELQEVFLEKFAELIVRECADLVDRAISNGGVDGRTVKEHFGVEE